MSTHLSSSGPVASANADGGTWSTFPTLFSFTFVASKGISVLCHNPLFCTEEYVSFAVPMSGVGLVNMKKPTEMCCKNPCFGLKNPPVL